jgi:hypothetical protein
LLSQLFYEIHRLDKSRLHGFSETYRDSFTQASPFKHVVLDDFLTFNHAKYLSKHFPGVDHEVWLDWKKRSPNQFGKLGPGDSKNFETLSNQFYFSLLDFNSSIFLEFLESLTNIKGLIPDPYFTGGGMHQILKGGILDIHTDFNQYSRLGLFRRLNVILYLTKNWEEGMGGELELWNKPIPEGEKVKSIAPIFNRLVVFNTDKTSFHGHPNPWKGTKCTRRSIALYYYTSYKEPDSKYDELTVK